MVIAIDVGVGVGVHCEVANCVAAAVEEQSSGNSNDGWTAIGCQSFLNMPLCSFAGEIESAVLLIHGEKAHSRYFSEGTFEQMTGRKCNGQSTTVGNKEIMITPGASHVDLYDDEAGAIPYDKLEQFFRQGLK